MQVWRRWLVSGFLLGWGVVSVVTAPPRLVAKEPVLRGAQVPAGVMASLRKACLDCHSDEPVYPWYARVAPVSMLLRKHVVEGRERLNLSTWGATPAVRRLRLLSDMANQVQGGTMPTSDYLWMHPEAKLSEAEVAAIFAWTQAERARVVEEMGR